MHTQWTRNNRACLRAQSVARRTSRRSCRGRLGISDVRLSPSAILRCSNFDALTIEAKSDRPAERRCVRPRNRTLSLAENAFSWVLLQSRCRQRWKRQVRKWTDWASQDSVTQVMQQSPRAMHQIALEKRFPWLVFCHLSSH